MAQAAGRNVHRNVINFESAGNSQGNCSCQAHHVPPRYFPEATSPFLDEETFCVWLDRREFPYGVEVQRGGRLLVGKGR